MSLAIGADPFDKFPRGWDTIELRNIDNSIAPRRLPGFPFQLIDNVTFPFSSGKLGLASDSIFLDQAVAANLTPTHSFALDYGTTAPGSEKGGEIVFGGYNTEKLDLNLARRYRIFADTSIPCPLQIKVSRVILKNMVSEPPGQFADVQLSGNTFTACLEPAMWTMVLPLIVQRRFNNLIINGGNVNSPKTSEHGLQKISTNFEWEYATYNYSKPADDLPTTQSLSFELEGSNMTINVPNNEIFRPSRKINPLGGWLPVEGMNLPSVAIVGNDLLINCHHRQYSSMDGDWWL